MRELHAFTGSCIHVFPSIRGDFRPMSENTINAALAAMGFKDEMVGHGWRTTFSTSMNAKGFNPDAIERQMAHRDPDAVRAAYNRSDYMSERVKMMQFWADLLDEWRNAPC